MPAPVESPFCERCEKNQLIVNRSLAEYLPEEEDPHYSKYEKALPQYQAQLEERYPPVCENCIERVQVRIRQAGYATKAEELRRKLDQSKRYQKETPTVRQTWTLAIIWLGKWVYITSVIAAVVWHGFGAIAYFDFSERNFDWALCLSEAAYMREAHQSCAVSSPIRRMVFYALVADLLTIWWNPKLGQKMKHANGRMRGLFTTWMIRLIVLTLDSVTYLLLKEASVEQGGFILNERVDFFHYTHLILLAVNILATAIGWKTVSIKYVSTKELLRPLDAHLPTAPRSNQTTPRKQHTTPLPNNTSFDSMAAGFASSFPSELNAYPSSPTLTATSYAATEDSDFTPWSNRKASIASLNSQADAMDWTPTHSRFSSHAPSLIPFNPPPEQPSPTKTQPVNILKHGADANPFSRRIPGAPGSWHKPALPPHPEERKRNFFEEDREKNREAGMGLRDRGVPRRVEREAELFKAPQFKYDAQGYTRARETGLEEGFNDLFSK
ncbi:uncharacterized protein N0V89_002357 [Didymosphaeria variabile]|uniref:Ima1 N-terminal domain-containing protein n=1 Tax=Didymosphaeria variabile TaxID=1932322 RepID=A0A9W8XRX9_9PLEO|nr:uncharacterized protein N0V89_002357 [Didymosphaeria variabile]KAJ4357781.1 hypothetical protein N0V89_002357 [Didymosphaeria variabile]